MAVADSAATDDVPSDGGDKEGPAFPSYPLSLIEQHRPQVGETLARYLDRYESGAVLQGTEKINTLGKGSSPISTLTTEEARHGTTLGPEFSGRVTTDHVAGATVRKADEGGVCDRGSSGRHDPAWISWGRGGGGDGHKGSSGEREAGAKDSVGITVAVGEGTTDDGSGTVGRCGVVVGQQGEDAAGGMVDGDVVVARPVAADGNGVGGATSGVDGAGWGGSNAVDSGKLAVNEDFEVCAASTEDSGASSEGVAVTEDDVAVDRSGVVEACGDIMKDGVRDGSSEGGSCVPDGRMEGADSEAAVDQEEEVAMVGGGSGGVSAVPGNAYSGVGGRSARKGASSDDGTNVGKDGEADIIGAVFGDGGRSGDDAAGAGRAEEVVDKDMDAGTRDRVVALDGRENSDVHGGAGGRFSALPLRTPGLMNPNANPPFAPDPAVRSTFAPASADMVPSTTTASRDAPSGPPGVAGARGAVAPVAALVGAAWGAPPFWVRPNKVFKLSGDGGAGETGERGLGERLSEADVPDAAQLEDESLGGVVDGAEHAEEEDNQRANEVMRGGGGDVSSGVGRGSGSSGDRTEGEGAQERLRGAVTAGDGEDKQSLEPLVPPSEEAIGGVTNEAPGAAVYRVFSDSVVRNIAATAATGAVGLNGDNGETYEMSNNGGASAGTTREEGSSGSAAAVLTTDGDSELVSAGEAIGRPDGGRVGMGLSGKATLVFVGNSREGVSADESFAGDAAGASDRASVIGDTAPGNLAGASRGDVADRSTADDDGVTDSGSVLEIIEPIKRSEEVAADGGATTENVGDGDAAEGSSTTSEARSAVGGLTWDGVDGYSSLAFTGSVDGCGIYVYGGGDGATTLDDGIGGAIAGDGGLASTSGNLAGVDGEKVGDGQGPDATDAVSTASVLGDDSGVDDTVSATVSDQRATGGNEVDDARGARDVVASGGGEFAVWNGRGRVALGGDGGDDGAIAGEKKEDGGGARLPEAEGEGAAGAAARKTWRTRAADRRKAKVSAKKKILVT